MVATKTNILIEQGCTFSSQTSLYTSNGGVLDVTGYEATGGVKKSYDSNTIYDFVITLESGILTLEMSANATSDIKPGRYVYDVYISSANNTLRIIEGLVTVTGQVTR